MPIREGTLDRRSKQISEAGQIFEIPISYEEKGKEIAKKEMVIEKISHLAIEEIKHLKQKNGGFSKAYQKTTGIAGYTLVYNSYGIQLVAHQHFHSKQAVIENGSDVLSVKRLVDRELRRKQVL